MKVKSNLNVNLLMSLLIVWQDLEYFKHLGRWSMFFLNEVLPLVSLFLELWIDQSNEFELWTLNFFKIKLKQEILIFIKQKKKQKNSQN